MEYAVQNGFFWLNCPLCGEPFGGHEVSDESGFAMVDGQMKVVCPTCQADGRAKYRTPEEQEALFLSRYRATDSAIQALEDLT